MTFKKKLWMNVTSTVKFCTVEQERNFPVCFLPLHFDWLCSNAAEISGGNYLQPVELPRRKKKAVAKRTKLNVDGTEVQNNISQGMKKSHHLFLK